MHATLWVDTSHQAWLTLYADGTNTWQPALGSMPLTPHHQLPDELPLAAGVTVEGDVSIGGQPVVTYGGLRFSTAGPLTHPHGEPAYGVGPVMSLSGRFRLRTGDLLRYPTPLVVAYVLWLTARPISRVLGSRAVYVWTAVALPLAAWTFVHWQRGRRIRRDLATAGATRARAVAWRAVPGREDRTLPLMLSLYGTDAAAGAEPLGTVKLDKEPETPIPYDAPVVVRGELRSGARVVVELGGRALPVTTLRTDIAPVTPYAPRGATSP